MAGAAVAGTAFLAFGAWKLATSSSDASSNPYSYRPKGTRTLKFMACNVWTDQEEVSLDRRIKAIGLLVKQNSPDVIMFQEVTPNTIKIFQNYEWRMDYKYMLPRLLPTNGGSFCIMMSKMPMEAKLIDLGSFDKSKYCVAAINVMGRTLLSASCHLTSSAAPKNQGDELLRKLAPWRNVVVGGAMNWNDGGIADWADWPSRWVDAWTVLRRREAGNTCGTIRDEMIANSSRRQKSLDRFICKLQDFKLNDIEIIGTEAAGDELTLYRNEKRPLWPSDQFGLVLTISDK